MTDANEKVYYTLAELQALPNLQTGHFADLKIDRGDERVWLSRMTVADGATWDNEVTVESYFEKDGKWGWHTTYTYVAS